MDRLDAIKMLCRARKYLQVNYLDNHFLSHKSDFELEKYYSDGRSAVDTILRQQWEIYEITFEENLL